MTTRASPSPPLISNPSETYQPNIIACAITTWLIGFTFVALRFYTRGILLQNVLGAEDWFILASLVFSAATCAGMIEQAIYGLGKHTLDIDPSLFISMGRAGWYTILWYMLTLLLTKISILLLYIRILSYHHARHLVYFILGIVVFTNGLWTLSTVVTACVPLQAFWDKAKYGPDAYCHPRGYWFANTGMHIGTDVLLYVLPLPVIVNLQVKRRVKVGMAVVFGLGFFVCTVSAVRLWDLVEEYKRTDFTFDNVSIAYLTCVEINAAIACACCMTLKPLVTKISTSSRRRISARGLLAVSGMARRELEVEGGNGGEPAGGPPTIGSMRSEDRRKNSIYHVRGFHSRLHQDEGSDTRLSISNVYEEKGMAEEKSEESDGVLSPTVTLVEDIMGQEWTTMSGSDGRENRHDESKDI